MPNDRRTTLPQTEAAARDLPRITLIGALSGALYAILYAIHQAIYRNGMVIDLGSSIIRGDPADRGRLWLAGIGYASVSLALVALYLWLLLQCRRGSFAGGRARTLALLFPVLFNLLLLFGRPYLSIDVFSYLAHGYLGSQPTLNPYVQPTREVADTPFGPPLLSFGWQAVHDQSPYGPLWTQIEIAALRVTQDIPTGMLLLKLVVVAASLASAALIWLILGRVRPQDQLLGTLFYLWNPLIVIEVAAEGHNDALMIVFVLAALLCAVSARPGWAAGTLVLGVLTKYVPLIFFLPLLVYLWRTQRDRRRLGLELLLGLAAGIACAALLYWPLWVGAATFEGVRLSGQASAAATPSGLLFRLLSISEPAAVAAQRVSLILGGLFALVVLLASWRVRDAASLLSTCALLILGYYLVVSPNYWPWYAALPVALMALRPRGAFLWLVVALTIGSRLGAPWADLVVNQFIVWENAQQLITGPGVLLPLICGLLLALRRWRAPRLSALPASGMSDL
jgi:hypothetical protein